MYPVHDHAHTEQRGRARRSRPSTTTSVVTLAVAVLGTACNDDGSDVDAVVTLPPATSTAVSAPSTDSPSTALATVDAFLAAVEQRDSDAASQYVAEGAPIAIAPVAPGEALRKGITLAGQVAWNDAWDVRREIDACRESEPRTSPTEVDEVLDADTGERVAVRFDRTVTCSYTARHRLGDVTDQSSSSRTATFRLLGDEIVYAAANPQPSDWAELFVPFVEWATSEHPERWAEAWNDEGPLLTEASSEIEDELLTQFVAEQR